MRSGGKVGTESLGPLSLPTTRDRFIADWAADYRFSPVAQITLDENGRIRSINIAASTLLKGEPAQLVNVPFIAFVDKADRRRFLDHVAQATSGAQKVFTQLALSPATRAVSPVELQSVPYSVSDARFCRTAIAKLPRMNTPGLDGTGLNAALLSAWDRSKERKREKDVTEINDLSRQILANNSVASALISLETECIVEVNQIFCQSVGRLEKQLVGQPLITIGLNRSDGDRGDLFHTLLSTDTEECEARISRPDGTTSEVLLSAKRIGSRHKGCLLLMMQDLTDLRRLRRDLISISEEERRRFGRELHDSYCQDLTAIAFFAESIAAGLGSHDDDVASQIRMLVDMVQKSAENLHALAAGLISQQLTESGLTTALEELTSRIRRQFGLACTANLDRKLDERTSRQSIHLYRIAQEALSNSAKHSRANCITLRLGVDGDTGILEVEDDGVGFLVHEKPRRLGISTMRYRASVIRGVLKIDSHPGTGTKVTCQFPIAQRESRLTVKKHVTSKRRGKANSIRRLLGASAEYNTSQASV